MPLAVAIVLLAVGGPAPALAQDSRAVVWEQFDVAIDVLPDGTLRVTQTETIRFDGTFQRAFREIPLGRVSSITEVQVSEPGRRYGTDYGRSYNYAATRSDDQLRIEWWFPPTTNATRTFEIRYRVSGAILVYPEGDQLWWVAVPADRPGPVESSEVVVRLPRAVPPSELRAEQYLGRGGQPAASVSGQELRFTATDIPPGRPFEVRVQFPHALVNAAPPPWQADYDRQAAYESAVKPVLNLLLLVGSLLILFGGSLLLFLRWYTRGRDPAGVAIRTDVVEPPSDLPPGLVGTVVDERADLQDVLATLVDLGNRGIIRITEIGGARSGRGLDYKLELLQEQPLGLRAYERTVLGALFAGQREVQLSHVKDRWSAYIPLFQDQLHEEAARARLFEANPDDVRKRARGLGLTIVVGSIIGAFVALTVFSGVADALWLPFVALAVVGLVAVALASRMPRRTKAGVIEAARWKAFARHLEDARDEPRTLDSEHFARYLPYAVALGVDQSWLDNFAAVRSAAPRWYGGAGPVIIGGPGGWGFPGGYGPTGTMGGGFGGPGRSGRAEAAGQRDDAGWMTGPGESGGIAGGLGSASGGLADLLNAASEALSHGGGRGWSGGGGGGWGGGGGSGGGRAGFG